MKRIAIVVLLVPFLLLGVLSLRVDKADHNSSPAFSVALDQAIGRLEGTAVKVTSAVVPPANAGALQPTLTEFTCIHGEPTCDGLSPTCTATCGVWETCKANPECGITYTGEPTCDQTPTCVSTCGTWPTCDGEITCAGYEGYTCDPKNPECTNDTERTSWGQLKKQFE
ncbi:MAG: hypothetical protein KAX38_04215 [Candidatus Krumholzibacteria bacterium]|nr:hypothetical protein [Candidatus Krumholzibacteria bacterium]